MIQWKDFIFDDVLGPVLMEQALVNFRVAQEAVVEIKEDARAAARALGSARFQEARQGQQPARMAGSSSLTAVQSGEDATHAASKAMRIRGGR